MFFIITASLNSLPPEAHLINKKYNSYLSPPPKKKKQRLYFKGKVIDAVLGKNCYVS
jgi:hypothetical protein